jgi:hypothetical protein
MEFIHKKTLVTGKTIFNYVFEKPIILGTKPNKRIAKKRNQNDINRLSVGNARNRLISLVRCNNDLKFFLTLTYAKAGKSLIDCNSDFRNFIKRVKRRYKNIKYIAVPELQKKRFKNRNEFAIHYHLLVNKEIEVNLLSELWGHGFVHSKELKGSDDYSAFYMSKYFTKDFISEIRFIKPKFKNYYYYSRNLNKPLKYYGIKSDSLIHLLKEKLKHEHKKTYYNKRLGSITVDMYTTSFNISEELSLIDDLYKFQKYDKLKKESRKSKITFKDKHGGQKPMF